MFSCEHVHNELKNMSRITSSADLMITRKKGKEGDTSNQKGFSDLTANTSRVFLGLPTPVLNSYQSDVFFYILQHVKFQL